MRGEVAYVKELGSFFTYNGQIWDQDSGVRIVNIFDSFVLETLDTLRADKAMQHSEFARQSSFLRKYRNRRQRENAISSSQSAMLLAMSKLDANRDLIAVKNGVLNLRTGELLDFDPSYYITRQLAIEFDPKATCPLFESFLNTTFNGDNQLIDYVQGILGYAMTPSVNRQELYFLHGIGANGKSTLMNVIRHIFGQYSASMMKETLFEKSNNNTYADLASMRSVRMAFVQEAESDRPLNGPRVKEMTGGDPIRVVPKYKAPFDLTPEFKIFVQCNIRPSLDAYDQGLRRRIVLIPFDHVVPKEDRDPNLEEKLKAEASGIVNWLLLGARSYFKGKIIVPQKVSEATNQYLDDNDSVRSFVNDRTQKDPVASISIPDLYEAYVEYSIDESIQPELQGKFGKILKQIGFDQTKTNSARVWKGLRLKTVEDEKIEWETAFPRGEGRGIDKFMKTMV